MKFELKNDYTINNNKTLKTDQDKDVTHELYHRDDEKGYRQIKKRKQKKSKKSQEEQKNK